MIRLAIGLAIFAACGGAPPPPAAPMEPFEGPPCNPPKRPTEHTISTMPSDGDTQLIVLVDVERGTLMIDGVESAVIEDGTATVKKILPGTHRVGLGFEHYGELEDPIAIEPGVITRVQYQLGRPRC